MPMAIKPQHPLPWLVLAAGALLSLFVLRAWFAGGTNGSRKPRQPWAGHCVSQL